MELLNYSSLEYIFICFASYLLLISFYFQNKNLYQDFVFKEVVFNKDIIKKQLTDLNISIKNNKFKYWSYQFTIFSITPILYIFNIGDNLKHIWLALAIFLLIQYIIEYRFFILETLDKVQSSNKSVEKVLYEMETAKSYEKINLNKFQENIQKEIKTIIKKKTFEELNINEKRKIYSFLIGKESKDTFIKKSLAGYQAYNESKNIVELDTDDFILSEIIEFNSSFYNNFYERIYIEKMFTLGLLEPILLSFLLFAIISIKI